MNENAIFALIPILGISCGLVAILANAVFRPWLRMKERQMELDARLVAEKAAQYAADKGRLEERVQVLERIVTDQGYSLASEIETLRRLPN
jgi:ABC-type phosphate transport system auxiliary subunit